MNSGQRGHLADGVLLFPDGKQIAIEVELTMKGSWRLNKIISHYTVDHAFKEVWYFCAPGISTASQALDSFCSFLCILYFNRNIFIFHESLIIPA